MKSDRAQELADILKGLSHPIRLRIINRLCQGEANVTELCNELDVKQSLVSQHLAPLRMLGLVQVNRSGGHAHYSLGEPKLRVLLDCLTTCGTQVRVPVNPE